MQKFMNIVKNSLTFKSRTENSHGKPLSGRGKTQKKYD